MNQPLPLSPQSAQIIQYKPSAYYYRRALRAGDATLARVGKIVGSLRAEIALCSEFADDHGVAHQVDTIGQLFSAPANLDGWRTLGLRLCCELENVKQAIRDRGLIPPKRNIMRSEAQDKGWELRG